MLQINLSKAPTEIGEGSSSEKPSKIGLRRRNKIKINLKIRRKNLMITHPIQAIGQL
jgi:hypothetical protein